MTSAITLDAAIINAFGYLPEHTKRNWTYRLAYTYRGEVQLSAFPPNRPSSDKIIAIWPVGDWDEARAEIAGSVLGSKDANGNPIFNVTDYGPVSAAV